jgi:hypothetical protein
MWRTISAIAATVVIVLGAGIGVLVYAFGPHCDREETILASDGNGRSIVAVFEACTGFGTETSESIQLKSASGDRKNIFVYVPNGGTLGCNGKTFPPVAEPSADWTDPRLIHIAIGVVSSIVERHETVDGMRVTYDPGPVLSEVCRVPKTSVPTAR